jgi:transposase
MIVSKEWLYQKYVVEQLSQLEISILAGVGHSTIQRKLKKFSIPTRASWESSNGRKRSDSVKNKLTIVKISNKASIPYLYDKDWLYKKHIIECCSVREISRELKVDTKTVRKHMKQLGVPIRRHSDAILRGEKHPLFGHRGANAAHWLGGKSFEPYCPKFNFEFKERVRAYFNHKCFLCGTEQNGIRLSVHHVDYDKNVCCNDITPLFVPLCLSCHMKTNRGSREEWAAYYRMGIYQHTGGTMKTYFSKDEYNKL